MIARWWQGLLGATFDNPVLLKELRVGLRERRIFVIQMGFLLFLGLVCHLMVLAAVSHSDPQDLPEAGQYYFQVVFWVQLGMLLLATPSLTCGSICGERERHSLDMVLASRLTTTQLVLGKLGFALFYVILLLFSSLPMAAVVFFLGGVGPSDAFQAYLELACAGLLTAQLGLFFSARETRSNYATGSAYLVVFLSTFFLPSYGFLRLEGPKDLGGFLITPLSVIAGLALYAFAFMFFKTQHRLRPRAIHIYSLQLSFLAVYVWLMFLFRAFLFEQVTNWTGSMPYVDDLQFLLILVILCHLVAAGVMTNEHSLDSARERHRYERNPLSRRWFWLSVFMLGLLWLLEVDVANSDGHVQVYLTIGLVLVYLLSLTSLAGSLKQIFPRYNRGRLYLGLLILLCTLPNLGLLLEDPGLFSGTYLSPILALSNVWSAEGGKDYLLFGYLLTPAATSVLAYLTLTVLGLIPAYLSRRRRAAGG